MDQRMAATNMTKKHKSSKGEGGLKLFDDDVEKSGIGSCNDGNGVQREWQQRRGRLNDEDNDSVGGAYHRKGCKAKGAPMVTTT